MSSILAWRSLLAPLLLAFIFVLTVNYLGSDTTDETKQLSPPAAGQDVYVLGNSMFGTGLDLERLRSELPGETVDFGYYNGHYSSMWYLAATQGMTRRTAPDTLVWGFRPTYAILPAFRQNKDTAETVLAQDAPATYNNILLSAGDPTRSDLPGKAEDADQQVNFSGRQSTEPFERYGAILADLIKAPFDGMNGERNVLSLSVNKVSSEIDKVGAAAGIESLAPEQNNRPTDLLIAYVTNGRIQKADALVVDNGDRFIQGEKMSFADSFIPPTSEAFKALGVRQVVVIFKPVTTFESPMDAQTQAFYEDAKRYFEREGIEVIDLLDDPSLKRSFFASGDHYNQDGARYVTDKIAQQIKSGR